MDRTIQGPVVCPVLVAREVQLGALVAALERAAAGQGGTVLIAGEAGVGKSRLVSEMCSRAAANGLLVAQGSCFETDRSLPYGPLAELLHGWYVSQPRDLEHEAAELLPLVPELATRVPRPASALAVDPATEQRRLFEAVARVIAGAAARRPVLLVIEDLHWADDGSLAFLWFLSRRIASMPVVLVATYRSDEQHANLRRMLAQLDRGRLAAELRLEPLARPEVETMVRAIFDLRRPARRAFVDAIHALTEGNPFFIEELLKALIVEGHVFHADVLWRSEPMDELPIPRTVEDAVQRRTATLSGGARQVLDLAAVAGRRFDLPVLEDVLGRAEPELVRDVKELVAAQLVEEESLDRYAFRHALTREAVYKALLGRQRAPLHLALAEASERHHAATIEGHAAELARHFFVAGAFPRAAAYARRAAEHAQALFTPRAAVELYTLALRASQRAFGETDVELHQLRGRANATLGEFDAALADQEEALALARRRGNQEAEVRTLLDLAALHSERDYTRTGQLLEEGLRLARALGDPPAIAASLNALGNWYMNQEEPGAALRHHQEALEIFERLDDGAGIAEALGQLGGAFLFAGDAVQSAECYTRAIALRSERDDRPGLASMLAGRTLCAAGNGTDSLAPTALGLADAVRHGEESLRLARDGSWAAGEVFALLCLTTTLVALGDYPGAFARLAEAAEIAHDVEHHEWTMAATHARGELLLDVLALTPARQCLEDALGQAREVGSAYWATQITGTLSRACVAGGDLVRAQELLDTIPSRPRANSPARRLCGRVGAELALAGGRAGDALRLVEQLIASTPNLPAGTVLPRLWLVRAGALAALGRSSEAESDLRAARETALAQGARPLVWRCDAALSSLYRSQGRRSDATLAWEKAEALVDDLAAGIPDESLRQGFLAAAVAGWGGRRRTVTPRRARQRAYDGLTDREREVATLVGRGFTNRQIAEALVMSPATVETHVKHVLGKLRLTSRAQVVRWAGQKGLLDP